MTIRDIVSDEDMIKAFKNTNFGNENHRYVLSESLLKVACGFKTGSTIKSIGIELGLRKVIGGLTKKGQNYLYAAYEKEWPNL